MAVLHAEAAGDDAERLEAEALVQVPRVCVAGDDGVELQDAEAARPALPETVGHQLFADVQTARFPLDRVAGVADVSAAADVVGMQDVQTVNMAGLPVLRDAVQVCSAKKAAPEEASSSSSCGKATPSSTTSFQMRISAGRSACGYARS